MRLRARVGLWGRELCRDLHLRPVAKGAERSSSGAAGIKRGANIEKAAEDVVLHPGNFSGFLRLLPALARQLVVEVDLLAVIDDA